MNIGPLANAVVILNDGAPVDGDTGAAIANPGSLYFDTTNFVVYLNTGTLASPTWTLMTGSTVLAGVTPGTVAASKALVVDANKDLASLRNVTVAQLTLTTLIVGATTVTATGAEINVLAGVTPGTVTASKVLVVDANKDVVSLRNLTATKVTAGIVFPLLDPHVAGVWWDNAGTLTKSAG